MFEAGFVEWVVYLFFGMFVLIIFGADVSMMVERSTRRMEFGIQRGFPPSKERGTTTTTGSQNYMCDDTLGEQHMLKIRT